MKPDGQKFISFFQHSDAGIAYMRILNLVFHRILSVSYMLAIVPPNVLYTLLRIFLSRTLTAIKPNRKWGKTKNANSRVSFCRFSCVLFISGLPRLSEMGMAVLARLWRWMYILKRFIPRSFAADVSKLSAQMAPNGDTCCTSSIAANRVDI
jgi:hypothetical protein